jgi:P4 family phage/plasmid primase-like protien
MNNANLRVVPPSSGSHLDWVLRYLRLGWPVFPLAVRSKMPMIAVAHGGKGCLDATLHEETAREWWTRWPKANIGLATGHRFFVFDVDPLKGGADTLDELVRQYGKLPDTVQQVTGTGGTHHLFQLPSDFRVANTESYIGQGLDTRGFHGYIVAAPSIHPDTGRQYFWDGVAEIEEQHIAEAPAWILEKLRQHGQRAAAGPVPVPANIPKGQQHKFLVSLAGTLRKRGLDADAIFATLWHVNENQCTEPGPERNIRRIAESAARWAPDARVNLFAHIPESDGADENPAGAADAQKGPAEVSLSAADVEAAIKTACDADDLAGAMRLIPEIAKVPLHSYTLIQSMLRKKFKRDFPVRDFTRAVKELQEVLNAPPAPADDDDGPPPDAPDLIGSPMIPLTDSGNGERIVRLCGEDIRFCSEFKKWLLWDGRQWKVDTDAATVTQRAKTMARILYQQAINVSDPVLQKAIKTHARDSESQGSITAALLRAKSEPGMAVSATELDQHRYLLNCMNGVVDVRTGELLEFQRRYYITKLCHVKYNPDSEAERDCPRFLKLLHWAMGETSDMGVLPERVTRMVAFLQKAFGYALTADVSEKAAFIFYGAKGNNGKTTLLTVFKTLLAEYATQLDINTLMTSKFTDNNVRADLAKLHGARFVITSEVDDGQRLSERLMKYLTAGMGEITACRKFENPFEFTATHKIWMDCNYRPEIKGTDEAIWGRLHCIPFLQRIAKDDPEIDKQLLGKILAESEGVLAWAVRGAMRWAKDGGLGVPPEVEAAGAEWREADDPLKPFIDECCVIDLNDDDCWVRCADFTKAYQQWCKDNNELQLKSSRLTQRLDIKGIKLNRSRRVSDAGKQARCWDGVSLREDVTLISAPRAPRHGYIPEP